MKCGERREWGNVKFREMLLNISGNAAKHSVERCQIFRGMFIKPSGKCSQSFRGASPNIPENVAKYSGECHQTFWGILSNILGNVIKHSG